MTRKVMFGVTLLIGGGILGWMAIRLGDSSDFKKDSATNGREDRKGKKKISDAEKRLLAIIKPKRDS